MDQENPFLASYKKKLEAEVADDLHFEEQSAFAVPSAVALGAGTAVPRKPRLKLIIIGVVILAAAGILLFWLFGRGVTVIDVTGWTVDDVRLWTSDKKINLQIAQVYDDDIEAGKVVRQELASGSKIARNGFFKIDVSLGHDLDVALPLPDIINMTVAQIESWAAENYMAKVRITTEYSATVAAGQVLRFEINDDTVVDLVKRSSPVYVIVSRGPAPEQKITLPDFSQMPLNQSRQFAKEHQLDLEIVEDYDDLVPPGEIIGQSIAPQEEVDQHSRLVLTVSKGRKIIVPDFSSQDREKAAATAVELGIELTLSERYSDSKAGVFLGQSLEAGSIYESGTVVELAYSLGNQITLPDFVGQPQVALESWAQELNEQGAHLKISVQKTQNSAPKGIILYQNKANTMVGVQTTVQITVSLGRLVVVPDLVAPAGSDYSLAVTRDRAAAVCEGLGLIPVFVEEKKSGRLPGEIWQQNVSPGREVYEHSLITLKYNPLDVIYVLPDFRGQTEQAIIAAGYLKKFKMQFDLSPEPVLGLGGTVVAQSARPGEEVAAGAEVTLVIAPPESEELD